MNSILNKLKISLPEGIISFSPEDLERCSHDKYIGASNLPQAVAFPSDTQQIATILQFANTHQIPVTPRGAGVGYCGGATPVRNGIVLSLERMNQILEMKIQILKMRNQILKMII